MKVLLKGLLIKTLMNDIMSGLSYRIYFFIWGGQFIFTQFNIQGVQNGM